MINIETGVGGRTYQIWKQQQKSSCGVASTWMARGIARQMSFAEEEWELAVRMYQGAVNRTAAGAATVPAGPMSIDPRAYPNATEAQIVGDFRVLISVGGLTTSELAMALQNEGLRAQNFSNNGNAVRVAHERIAYNKPAIAQVLWDPGNAGSHFIVVGRCTSHHVTFLDPWSGHIREQPNDGRYRSSYGDRGKIINVTYVSA